MKREQVRMLVSFGVSRRRAAAYVGCDPSTISHAIRRDADFARQIRSAEATAEMEPLLLINRAGRKSWRAAAWLLKHNGPGRSRRALRDTLTRHQIGEALDRLVQQACEEGPADEKRRQTIVRFADQIADELDLRQRDASGQRRPDRGTPSPKAPPAAKVPDDSEDPHAWLATI